MFYNNMRGALPKELSVLTGLTVLALEGNKFGGTIPDWLNSLTGLTELALGFSELVGSIPEGLTALDRLTDLQLQGNRLTGVVPDLPFKQYTRTCSLQSPSSPNNTFTCPLPPNSKLCKKGPPRCAPPATTCEAKCIAHACYAGCLDSNTKCWPASEYPQNTCLEHPDFCWCG